MTQTGKSVHLYTMISAGLGDECEHLACIDLAWNIKTDSPYLLFMTQTGESVHLYTMICGGPGVNANT